MNKKISTLLAGVALLGAMTANAAGEPVKSLDKTSTNLYQLKFTKNGGADALLGMNANGKLISVDEAGLASDELASTLWCVTVVDEKNGQNVVYNFMNKATGQRLDIPYDGTDLKGLAGSTFSGKDVIVGGEIEGWAFSPQYKVGMTPATIYSHFSSDSVIGLVNNAGVIDVMKLGSAEAAGDAQVGDDFTLFTLQTAEAVILEASEINSKLGTLTGDAVKTGVKLKFAPDEKGVESFKNFVKNPFATDNFLAQDVTGDPNYVYILKTDSSYLFVDTAYTNTSGSKFLAFNWSKLDAATRKTATAEDSIKSANNLLTDQFKFAFTYYPSIDSLVIQVKKVTRTDAVGAWNVTTSAILDDLGVAAQDGENNFVTVQDLIKDNVRIITVADKKESDIMLGYTGCGPVASDKFSVVKGLYIIRNAADQVLASPIHKNGKYEWVTLDEQKPEHMPAYQWIVTQNQTADAMKETSPITIQNREFGNSAVIQLSKKDGKVTGTGFTFGTAPDDFTVAAGTQLDLKIIDDSTIIKDKYLGYKNLKVSDLQVTKYKFNYLHPFSQSKWIEKGADKDSVLYARDTYTAFSITKGTEVQYGVKAGNKISGLADLYRTQYLITLGADTLGAAAQDKYALGKIAPVDSFYFKENNHHNDNHYYAIVKAYMNKIANNADKVGVADDGLTANLKVQELGETRTSSFAISVDSVPLYRRFNNAALGENADDAPDSLRFYENARHEYLMDENNPNLTDKKVDYLGIWTKDKATGLSFRIDTAWVKRDLGYIKPQYLISVNNVKVPGTPGIVCQEPGEHITADGKITDKAEDCKHSHPGIAGFVYGKYLVSFADSVAKKADKPYTDVTDGYTRVGFVKAIKSGDKLFVLVNGFENMDPTKLDTATIAKAYTAAKVYNTYVVSLKGDNHKNYTWSFRHTNPDKAANVTEEDEKTNSFLIESMAYNEGTHAKPVYKNIAPEKAAWIKMQNGCIVLTDDKSTFNNAKTGGDGALVFNVDHVENDNLATDNETITTSEFSVIAGQGQVTIANAEGKKVIISNLLGQVVANTVITSDNATIAVPAGVVVVAVEGEAAAKVIVL